MARSGPAATLTAESAAPALLGRLRETADAWQAAPIGSVAESDAAGEMYGAIQALLAEGDEAP
jgi:hypothetical protein